MGMKDRFDDMQNKAKDWAGKNKDKTDAGMDKAGDFADEKTGGKYGEQIDKGADKGKEGIGKWAGQDDE